MSRAAFRLMGSISRVGMTSIGPIRDILAITSAMPRATSLGSWVPKSVADPHEHSRGEAGPAQFGARSKSR